MHKTAFILQALPGLGKSTLAAEFARQGAVIISLDTVRERLYGDASIMGEIMDVLAVAMADCRAACAAGRWVVIDNTHSRRFEMDTWLDILAFYHYEITVYRWSANVELSKLRNAERRVAGVRYVPDDVIERMALYLGSGACAGVGVDRRISRVIEHERQTPPCLLALIFLSFCPIDNGYMTWYTSSCH